MHTCEIQLSILVRKRFLLSHSVPQQTCEVDCSYSYYKNGAESRQFITELKLALQRLWVSGGGNTLDTTTLETPCG